MLDARSIFSEQPCISRHISIIEPRDY